MKTLAITHFLDEDGTPLVSVPLTNSDKSVVLYQADFNQLYELGVDPRWRLSYGQILERGRSKLSVTRLIANAKSGDKIQILDRDPCNLKRDNLVTAAGGGMSKTRDKLFLGNRPHKFLNTVVLKHVEILPSWGKTTSTKSTKDNISI